jgi:uncharacterized protein (TIGR00369 family)
MALLSHSTPTQLESPVNFVPKNAPPRHDGAVQATSGEFAGWWTWTRDNFEVHNGPFWHREEGAGAIRCAFRLEKKHINGSGAAHGGCLLAFADYCLFAISNKVLGDGRGVTLSFASEFIDAAYEGELIEGDGEVVRAGRSILFLRGTLTSAGRPVLTFSGTLKRINAPRKPD